MSVDEGVSEFGQFQVVTINRGGRDGVEVGHVLASYRRGEVVSGSRQSLDEFVNPSWFSGLRNWFHSWRWEGWKPVQTAPEPAPARAQVVDANVRGGEVLAGGSVQLPEERNGLVFVFRVFEKMSYAMVMRATKPIYIGDIVQTP